MAYPSPTSLFERARGRSLTSILQTAIGSWVLALSSSFIFGVEALTELLIFPVNTIVRIADSTVDAIILGPLTVAITGSETTAAAVTEFGIFGLPLGTGIVLFTLLIVGAYLKLDMTSDLLPGTFTDFLGPFAGTNEAGEDGE